MNFEIMYETTLGGIVKDKEFPQDSIVIEPPFIAG